MNTIQITIQRGDIPRTYPVPYLDGMSVLDALKYLSATVADDLAFRWECGQGVCGVCTMQINGRASLSCTVLAQPGESYTCAPLTGFPVKRDLVIDLTPNIDSMMYVQPYLLNAGRPIESDADADASRKLRTCIECWACVSVCPVSAAGESAHALSMVKLARFALDPRDGGDRRGIAAQAGLSDYVNTCAGCRACADICPKGIDVYIDAVQVLAAPSEI